MAVGCVRVLVGCVLMGCVLDKVVSGAKSEAVELLVSCLVNGHMNQYICLFDWISS